MGHKLPEAGADWTDLKQQMLDFGSGDADWRHGRTGMYVFFAGDDVLKVAKEAYTLYMSENALGPYAFPSLKRMEQEVINIGSSLLHGPDDGCGSMTSGGTESIFLAIKSARDRAASRGVDITKANIVVPYSAHLAFDKACHYLGLEIRKIPLAEDHRADPAAMADSVDSNTILVAGSAPAFPHGLIDPIEEIANIALKKDLWMHVDACVGGYFAPFAAMNGAELPSFDFSVPGVCTMSADLHKYGYCAKGASTVLYRDKDLFSHQQFDCDQWPAGRMVTPNIAGTRPGGAVAAAWAVLHYLGQEGYRTKAKLVTDTREKLEAAIDKSDDLVVWGKPQLGLIAYGSKILDIQAVWKKMFFDRGWFIGTIQEPAGIHMMLTPAHADVIDIYIDDLNTCVTEVKEEGGSKPTEEFKYSG